MWNLYGKMWHNSVIFCLLVVPYCNISAEVLNAEVADPVEGEEQVKEIVESSENEMEDAIESFEQAADAAMNVVQKDILPEEEIDNFFEKTVPPIERIMDLFKDTSNVYKFIEARGIDRVIFPYLQIGHNNLRTQLLKLTQLLFDVAPTTTSVVIPSAILDKLLDIFEQDDNLAMKARTIYILHAWLPDNPKMQARVMKLKGLEPFYEQMHKLDANVIDTQMKLLSKIIKEHIRARNAYQQKSKTDLVKLNIYKKIGLLERLSTDRFCHGLFIIFKKIWENSGNKGDNQGFLYPVFEIIADIQPYCTDTLKGRTGTIEMLQGIYKLINDIGQSAKDYYERLGLNTTDFKLVLEKYVDKLAPTNRDEF